MTPLYATHAVNILLSSYPSVLGAPIDAFASAVVVAFAVAATAAGSVVELMNL
jgi:hypothetical protein